MLVISTTVYGRAAQMDSINARRDFRADSPMKSCGKIISSSAELSGVWAASAAGAAGRAPRRGDTLINPSTAARLIAVRSRNGDPVLVTTIRSSRSEAAYSCCDMNAFTDHRSVVPPAFST